MPYILSCDFSENPNPMHCIIEALEIKCNAPHLLSEFGINLNDLQDAFAFIPDQEIIIECHQTSLAFDLNNLCAQLNNGKSKKKFTLIIKSEPYQKQAEIRRKIESDYQNIKDNMPNENIEGYQDLILAIQEAIDGTSLSLNHPELYQLKIVYQMGEEYQQNNRLDDALSCYDRAITLCQSNHLNQLNLIFLMLKMAQIFLLKTDYHSAQEIYEALLPVLSSVLYENNDFLINIKILLINTYIRQEKFDLATNEIVLLRGILPEIINYENQYTHAMLQSYLGIIYLHENSQINTLGFFQQAINCFEKTNQAENYYYAFSLLEVSKNEISKNDFINADLRSIRGFQILQNLKETPTMLTESYNIAKLFQAENQLNYALKYFEYAKIILQQGQMENPSVSLAQVLNEIATIHYIKGNVESALSTYIMIINLYIGLNQNVAAMNCVQYITPLLGENSPEAEAVENLKCIIYQRQPAPKDETAECGTEKADRKKRNITL